jgi:protein SCO1/2
LDLAGDNKQMTPPTKKPLTTIVIVIVGIVAALAGALLAQSFLPREPVSLVTGTLLQPSKPIPAFALIDQDGNPFTSQQLQGHWSVLFFGFTNCPDICPTTLTLLAAVDKQLADLPNSKRPRITLVTADAQRDTPEQLKQYVQFFNPNFAGVTGTQTSLEAFALSVGAPIAIRPQAGGGYSVDHSAAIFVIDPQGALRAVFSGPHQLGSLTADLRTVVGA